MRHYAVTIKARRGSVLLRHEVLVVTPVSMMLEPQIFVCDIRMHCNLEIYRAVCFKGTLQGRKTAQGTLQGRKTAQAVTDGNIFTKF
jgi:hypothetical protein